MQTLLYSRTSLYRSPLGKFFLEGCPYVRGGAVLHFGHNEVSSLESVPTSGVAFMRGSTTVDPWLSGHLRPLHLPWLPEK